MGPVQSLRVLPKLNIEVQQKRGTYDGANFYGREQTRRVCAIIQRKKAVFQGNAAQRSSKIRTDQ